MKVYALALLLPVILAAQQGTPGARGRSRAGSPPAAPAVETKPADRCSIEGQVLNAATGEAVRKANLMLRRVESRADVGAFPLSYSSITDAAGRFTMSGLEPGRYRLSVNRTGFVSAEYGARGPGRAGTTLALEPGQRLADLSFRLTPHGVIAGRVVDEDGEPVAYAQIQTMRYRYANGRKQLMPSAGASTNDLGEYRIFGLAPGRYYLSATYRGGTMFEPALDRSAAQGPEENYVPTFYPGTIDPGAAAMVEVAAGGQLRGVDFAVSRVRTVRVRGRVQNATGTEGRNIMVMLAPRERVGYGNMNRTRVRDPEGNFEIRGVPPGAYTLVATLFDRERSFSARQPLEVGSGDVENVQLTLAPGADLSGRVRVEGEAATRLADVRLMLRPADSGALFIGGMSEGRVKEDGSFSISNVGPEPYHIMLMGLPEGYYVKAIRAGDLDLLETGLDLTRGAAPPLEILLSPKAGSLEGVVLNAKQEPASGATVVLVPQDQRRAARMEFYKNTTTDQYGRFSLKGLDPGEYKVFAWEDVEYGAYLDPDFVKPVESQSHAVTIRESSQESVQLTVIPADEPRQGRAEAAAR